MKKYNVFVAIFGAAAMASCGQHGGGAPPSGQVAARVDGKEITLSQIRLELAAMNVPNGTPKKAAEQSALNNILARTIIADAARAQHIQKTPEFAMRQQRADDALLASSFEERVIAQVPPPSSDQVNRFISDNPDMFSERKIYAVDQLQIPRLNDPSFFKAVQPMKTMAEVISLLQARKIPFQRGTRSIDLLSVDQRLATALPKLPPQEIFIIGGDGSLLINQVVDTKTNPITGADAERAATAILKRRTQKDAVNKQFGGLIAQKRSSVVYNPAFAPPKNANPTSGGSIPSAKSSGAAAG